MMHAADYRTARRILCKRIAQLDPEGEAALFLSGGVDSATVLFAMLASGRKPHCYTFQVAGSANDDVTVAASICARFGLQHTIVDIPRSLEQLVEDVHWVLRMVNWRLVPRMKKTIVQCCHPCRYLYPAVESGRVLWGLGGDDLFRTAAESMREDRRDGWQAHSWKRRTWDDDPRYSNYHILDLGQRAFSKQTAGFYHFPAWWGFVQQFPTPETNLPRQKYLAAGAFADYWSKGSWYRENQPFQIVSGLRQYHNLLLSHPAYARLGARDVLAIYNKMADELRIRIGTDVPPESEALPVNFKEYAAEWA